MSEVTLFRAERDRLEVHPVQADALDESTLKTAHGVYTVMRVFEGRKTFRLASHWRRLRASARLLGMRFTLTDGWLRQMLHDSVGHLSYERARVRLTIPFTAPTTALISCQEFVPPPDAIYTRGVKLELVNGKRDLPRAKNTTFIEWRRQAAAAVSDDVYELLLISDNGEITEGSSSNFYITLNGTLRTPETGMLEGIARAVLLDVASPIIPVDIKPIYENDLRLATEAMLTSASRSVVPVVRIGDITIGDGRPGETARALKKAFDARVISELEEI